MEEVGQGQTQISLVAALWCCTASVGCELASIAWVQPVGRIAPNTLSKSARLNPA